MHYWILVLEVFLQGHYLKKKKNYTLGEGSHVKNACISKNCWGTLNIICQYIHPILLNMTTEAGPLIIHRLTQAI